MLEGTRLHTAGRGQAFATKPTYSRAMLVLYFISLCGKRKKNYYSTLSQPTPVTLGAVFVRTCFESSTAWAPAARGCFVGQASTCAPSIPRSQFSSLARLDQDRLSAMVSAEVSSGAVSLCFLEYGCDDSTVGGDTRLTLFWAPLTGHFNAKIVVRTVLFCFLARQVSLPEFCATELTLILSSTA